jgi:hypothetical protein
MVESDFDFESINLGLHQEYIELDLFNYGVATFSDQDFIDAGLTVEDRALLAFMATQEMDHATLLTNMLGQAAPKQCTYDYPFNTVREFVEWNVKLTRWGESGTWGFLSHLDSREVATLLVQAEAIEARQQMVFRQMLGLPPMPVSFTPGQTNLFSENPCVVCDSDFSCRYSPELALDISCALHFLLPGQQHPHRMAEFSRIAYSESTESEQVHFS